MQVAAPPGGKAKELYDYSSMCVCACMRSQWLVLTAPPSRYIQMSDGAKLAADLFVPRGVSLDTPMPTILHQTRWEGVIDPAPVAKPAPLHRRYSRTLRIAWPFSAVLGDHWSIRSHK